MLRAGEPLIYSKVVNQIESSQSQLSTFAELCIWSGSLTGDQLSIPEGPFKLAESVALVLKSVTAGDGDLSTDSH